MPRAHEVRSPARPTTDSQRDRIRRILGAAAELGARQGLEDVQMGDVAARADVAVGTLYRYFPSKHHLFAGVLADRVERTVLVLEPGPLPEGVGAAMAGAVRALLREVRLARAMLISTNVVRAEHEHLAPIRLDLMILRAADLAEVDGEDERLARLVEQGTYGVLTWATAGQVSPEDAAEDTRRLCELVLAPWAGRARRTSTFR